MINKRKAHLIMLNRKTKMDLYAMDGSIITHNRNLTLKAVHIWNNCYVGLCNEIESYIVFNKKIFDKSYKELNESKFVKFIKRLFSRED